MVNAKVSPTNEPNALNTDIAFGKVHVPYGGDGQGVYSAATLGCFAVIQAAAPMVLEAAQQVVQPGMAHVRIADFGTADGGTSMPLLDQVISLIRSKSSEADIEISYEDQPNNDYKSLFYHVQGIKQLPQVPVPYLKTHDKVYVTASGTSFHQQCFPRNSVHVAMSFTAMHWLSARPCGITTGVHATQAQGKEKELLAAQAAKDWDAILVARAAELVPGGQMVIANFGVSPEGHWLGHTDIGPCMYSTMDKLWRQMADEGRITQQEYEATSFINYYRNQAEMEAPFKEGGAAYKAGLRLKSSSWVTTRCPFRDTYLRNGGDPKAHAKWYVPTLRTWSNSTFTSGLDSSRTEAERAALVDELFKRYEEEVAADPSGHGMDYVHCFLHFERVA